MKNYIQIIIGILISIMFMIVYKLGISGLLFNETSFKMNGAEPRYVMKFRYAPIYKIEQISTQENESEGKKYFDKLNKLTPSIEKIFGGLNINENIFIYIENLGNYGVTAQVKNGKVNITSGVTKKLVPTMIFNISKEDIDGLEVFLQDSKLNEEEKLKITDVILKPMIERIYRLTRLYKVSDLSSFMFDDFIQFEITNLGKISRAGKPIDLKLTITNTDGQWLINKGFAGDPDVRFTMTLDKALEFYKLTTIDLENTTNKKDGLEISQKAFKILKESTSYVREDHK